MKRVVIGLKNGQRVFRKEATSAKDIRIQSWLRRKNLLTRTQAEMWAHTILAKSFDPKEFSCEHIFRFRRFDFYFHRVKIALEIDGSIHKEQHQKLLDKETDRILLAENGIRVLRVDNFDHHGIESAIKQIKIIGGNDGQRSREKTKGESKADFNRSGQSGKDGRIRYRWRPLD